MVQCVRTILGIWQNSDEGSMKKLTMTMTAAALALATMSLTAGAQTQQPGVAGLNKQLKNATPITTPVACGGFTGPYGCGPGWTWSAYWHRCVRCY